MAFSSTSDDITYLEQTLHRRAKYSTSYFRSSHGKDNHDLVVGCQLFEVFSLNMRSHAFVVHHILPSGSSKNLNAWSTHDLYPCNQPYIKHSLLSQESTHDGSRSVKVLWNPSFEMPYLWAFDHSLEKEQESERSQMI